MSDREYRQAVWTCLGAAGMTVMSTLILPLWSGFSPLGVVVALCHSDYTLIHLYFGMALFVVAALVGRRSWRTLAMFAALLVPFDDVRFDSIGRWDHWLSIAAFVYAVALVGLAMTVIVWGRAERVAPDDVKPAEAGP